MITVPLFNGQKYPVPSRPISRGPTVMSKVIFPCEKCEYVYFCPMQCNAMQLNLLETTVTALHVTCFLPFLQTDDILFLVFLFGAGTPFFKLHCFLSLRKVSAEKRTYEILIGAELWKTRGVARINQSVWVNNPSSILLSLIIVSYK